MAGSGPIRKRKRWLIGGVIPAILLIVLTVSLPRARDPVYRGRHLSDWLRGHPKEYVPVVRALGTNALPFLLDELQATDSGPARFAERLLAKASIGPLWTTARQRRYRAGLGLQILDTNAAPAVVDMIFSRPMQFVKGDSAYSAACALSWFSSSTAREYIRERLTQALQGSDTNRSRNACFAFSVWPQADDETVALLIRLAENRDPCVRVAAVKALILCPSMDDRVLPVLMERLNDEQATIRRLAIAGMGIRRTNAVEALPALRAAYARELTRSDAREPLVDGYYGPHVWSAKEIRWAIYEAIKAINPQAPLPADVP